MDYHRVLKIAAKNEGADLLLKGARVVNVFSGEIEAANVALAEGIIAGVGNYREAHEIIDVEGRFVLPGLIDGHIHIESTMLTPEGFAEATVPHGTTTVVADPHEIVNVCGLEGFRYLLKASRQLPLDIFFTVPSCVPATSMETAGGAIGPQEVREAFRLHPQSPALGEMMNYPGVIQGNSDVLEILEAAREFTSNLDGHAPQLSGQNLAAYLSTGISTDHECTTREEALEKIRLGMKIAIREGSAAQNLKQLLPIVNHENYTNFFFCCDDLHPGEIVEHGGITSILRKAVSRRMNPVRAVQLATINPARHYCLGRRGGIAPGYKADLMVVDNLKKFQAELVIKNGNVVARQGELTNDIVRLEDPVVRNTVRLPDLWGKLELEIIEDDRQVRVIEVMPGQITTRHRKMTSREALSDPAVTRVAVVERHNKNGNVSLGMVKGFGKLKGALASTVSHDSHNLILVGRSAEEMERAALVVAKSGGGLAVVQDRETLYHLPLPVAGLMSFRNAVEVAEDHRQLQESARRIGCALPEPFMTMSFLALPVIPELRITDRGLVDVEAFRLVDFQLEE